MPCLKLVITADDFGIGEERDDGIVECYRRGAVTRTSLLVNGLSATTAVSKARNIDLPIGLHLNLTEGQTVSNSETVPTLISADTGFMLRKMGFREALRHKIVDLNQVEIEIKAQIDKFVTLTGHLPKYVDGHQHVHILPAIADVFANVLSEYNISWTRLPLDDIATVESEFLKTVVKQSNAAKKTFESKNIKFTNSFVGLATMGKDMTVERLQEAILRTIPDTTTSVPAPSCELMVHPGYPCTTDNGGCGDGPDDFTKSHDREHEMDVLSDMALQKFYAESGIELCAYP